MTLDVWGKEYVRIGCVYISKSVKKVSQRCSLDYLLYGMFLCRPQVCPAISSVVLVVTVGRLHPQSQLRSKGPGMAAAPVLMLGPLPSLQSLMTMGQGLEQLLRWRLLKVFSSLLDNRHDKVCVWYYETVGIYIKTVVVCVSLCWF